VGISDPRQRSFASTLGAEATDRQPATDSAARYPPLPVSRRFLIERLVHPAQRSFSRVVMKDGKTSAGESGHRRATRAAVVIERQLSQDPGGSYRPDKNISEFGKQTLPEAIERLISASAHRLR
jgi:hypothetical protein